MKRYFLAVFVFLGFMPFNYAQVVPVLKSKPKPVVVKKSVSPPVEGKVRRPDSALITQSFKIICDASGDLFIDGEKKSRMEPDVPYRIKLPQGEYILKVVGADNPNDQIREKLSVKEIGPERLYEIGLKAIVEERLKKEAQERLEQQRLRTRQQEQELKDKLAEKEREQAKALQQQATIKDDWKTKYDEYVKNIKTLQIGEQTWMQENLNVDRFRNGDIIPEAKTAKEWADAGNAKKPIWCYYNFDSSNGTKYGRLYNWYAVVDPRELAPEGWYIPKYNEWFTMVFKIGMNQSANKLKSKTGWNAYKGKSDGNGLNTSGFSALPTGMINADGLFMGLGEEALWWTNSRVSLSNLADYMFLTNRSNTYLTQAGGAPQNGLAVRCLKQ